MRIAINTRFLIKEKQEGIGVYTEELCRHLVKNHPTDEFHFFFDRPFDKRFLFSENVEGHVVSPQARHPLLWYWWFEKSLAQKMGKIEPDVFFSPDGFASINSRVPTIMTCHDIAFRYYPEYYRFSHQWYYNKFFPKYLKQVDRIVAVSKTTKKDLLSAYGVDEKKVTVIYNGVSDKFRPISKREQEIVRLEISEGNPYFLYLGSIQPRKNISTLIKAFLLFKQTDNQNHKLILKGKISQKHTFYRKKVGQSPDIIHINDEKVKVAQVVGAATALCYLSHYEGFGIPILEAMQSGVPVINADNSSMTEVSGGATIEKGSKDYKGVAAAMVSFATDEELRNKQIVRGLKRSAAFSWKRAADELYKIFTEVRG